MGYEGEQGRPAESATETLISRVWQEVLNVPVTSVTDNFFLLGGTSMTAAHVVGELSRALGTAVPLRTVFEYTDLWELAEQLDLLSASAAAAPGSARNRFEAWAGEPQT